MEPGEARAQCDGVIAMRQQATGQAFELHLLEQYKVYVESAQKTEPGSQPATTCSR